MSGSDIHRPLKPIEIVSIISFVSSSAFAFLTALIGFLLLTAEGYDIIVPLLGLPIAGLGTVLFGLIPAAIIRLNDNNRWARRSLWISLASAIPINVTWLICLTLLN